MAKHSQLIVLQHTQVVQHSQYNTSLDLTGGVLKLCFYKHPNDTEHHNCPSNTHTQFTFVLLSFIKTLFTFKSWKCFFTLQPALITNTHTQVILMAQNSQKHPLLHLTRVLKMILYTIILAIRLAIFHPFFNSRGQMSHNFFFYNTGVLLH